MRSTLKGLLGAMIAVGWSCRGLPEFERDVRPILVTRCVACHGEDRDLQAGLDLRSHAALLRGGASGSVVTAGCPDRSLLVEMVEFREMPPDGEPVTPGELEVIRAWVAGGALP